MASLRIPIPVIVAATVGALALSGCGDVAGDGGATVARHPREQTAPISAADVARRLGNAFRAGLRRLSVITGANGESADLGQPVPAGLVDRVSCSGSARAGRWRCAVRWADVEGDSHRTRYRVARTPRGCFDASATPALGAVRDVTAQSFSQHPLQELSGARSGC